MDNIGLGIQVKLLHVSLKSGSVIVASHCSHSQAEAAAGKECSQPLSPVIARSVAILRSIISSAFPKL
jgi:hypothetical protein